MSDSTAKAMVPDGIELSNTRVSLACFDAQSCILVSTNMRSRSHHGLAVALLHTIDTIPCIIISDGFETSNANCIFKSLVDETSLPPY
jgi:hypothetical protein